MESSTLSAPEARAMDASTLTEAVRRTAAAHPDVIAVRTTDDSVSLSWSALLERAQALAGGLAALGVRRGDTVALMLGNRPEFHLADLAAVLLGATPFSVYTTYPAQQIEYLCRDSDTRVMFVERALLDVVLEARASLPDLHTLILVDGDAVEGTVSLASVEARGEGFAEIAEVDPDDVLTLIYTSGTTGPPKGVQLTHRNVMSAASGVAEIINFPAGAKVISWLPAAHIAERMAHHYIPSIYAGTITCCPNPRDILSYLPQVRPDWFFAVPRIWEKLKSGLEAMLAAQGEEQRAPMQAALTASLERVRLRQRGEEVPAELEQQVNAADAAMFSRLREMLGLDRVRAVNVGAAPTPVAVLEFFHSIGIELAELWGMSETCGAGTCNRPGHVRIGTVGPAAPGCEIRIAEDGEVLVKAPFVMPGYRGLPEKTAEAIDPDGWLHTGDIGELDAEGYLRIVDRKKELIINAAGKNMSPANIEAALKSSSPLIGQACCIGDARPFNTALIVLDADFAPAWAGQQGITDVDLETLAGDAKVHAAIEEAVGRANETLARVEQIKRFTILGRDWLPGGDELTPTMKLKRKPIAERYRTEIEAMYAK